MDTQPRCQFHDRLTPLVALNERHLFVISQLPSLPRQTPLRIGPSTRSRFSQPTEVGSPSDFFEYH